MRTDNKRRIVKLLDFDALYEARRDIAVILNRFDFTAPRYAETLSAHLFSSTNEVDFVARCECEYLKGNRFLDHTCPVCHQPVTLDMEAIDGHLEYRTWLEYPTEAEGGWLHPIVFNMLNRWLRVNGKKPHRYLEEILDPTVPTAPEIIDVCDGKGFQYLYKNFDRIIDWFAHHFKPTANRPNVNVILHFLKKHRSILFCRHMPVLASSLHPIVMGEGYGNNRRRFVDQSSQYVLLSASTLSYLAYSSKRFRRKDAVDIASWVAYRSHISYLTDKDCGVAVKQLSKKKALPRQHLYGGRLHLSARGVIVPISGPHQIDELGMPWATMVNLLRPHIRGRLMLKYGLTLGEAATRHRRALQLYDPLIYEIINDLIAECPYKGLPCLFNRNPSIRTGSIQLMFITSVKTDPNDHTIEFSVLAAPPPNADYDGDELNLFLLTEMWTIPYWMALHPSRQILDRNSPTISNMIGIPPTALVVWNTFLRKV